MGRVPGQRSVGTQQFGGKRGHLQAHLAPGELANGAFRARGTTLQAASEMTEYVIVNRLALDEELSQLLSHGWIRASRPPVELNPLRQPNQLMQGCIYWQGKANP